ncbi:hypothetical protein Cgig2_019518 [Carnegiea gigantea]|uniref:SWIM-type domain-containing protein n=1 Tax=Carnegiea gigantea TaxID=171969 RepID=A0A9Q1KHA5_9CARY|nr:hypothetical protein Cgig2_019518 [Carnegiea gigantea]
MLPGGRKDCVWVKEYMGVLEVLQIVEEAMGEGIRGRRIWYSLECNRLELLPLGRDGDVKKLITGNDEYAYLYVARSEDWKGGGCTDRGRGGAMVDTAGDVARAVDERVVTEQVVRDAAQGNIGEVEEVDEAAVRKTELEKSKNGVGDRIEKKLRKTLGNIDSVADVKLFDTALGEYGVLLTNNRSLAVNLAERKCSCKWWQLKGLPCAHAMVVIDKQKLWRYNYVSNCYKAGSQNMMYMNSIHPMKMHDSATVDNATSLIVGGEALNDGYNRRILPSLNPVRKADHERGELNLKGKASKSESAQNAERLDTTETRTGIRRLISM